VCVCVYIYICIWLSKGFLVNFNNKVLISVPIRLVVVVVVEWWMVVMRERGKILLKKNSLFRCNFEHTRVEFNVHSLIGL
jgi:hypothetical protein